MDFFFFFRILTLRYFFLSHAYSTLNITWKNWFWNWSANTLATWCKELTHWKRLWYWEGLKAGGEGEVGEWDGLMASRFIGHEFEQTPGNGEGQGSLACCSPWHLKELYRTGQLNRNNNSHVQSANYTIKSIPVTVFTPALQ